MPLQPAPPDGVTADDAVARRRAVSYFPKSAANIVTMIPATPTEIVPQNAAFAYQRVSACNLDASRSLSASHSSTSIREGSGLDMPGTADPLPAPAYCKRGRTFEAPSLFNIASCAGVSGIPRRPPIAAETDAQSEGVRNAPRETLWIRIGGGDGTKAARVASVVPGSSTTARSSGLPVAPGAAHPLTMGSKSPTQQVRCLPSDERLNCPSSASGHPGNNLRHVVTEQHF